MDGEAVGVIGGEVAPAQSELFVLDGLDEDWHRVEVAALVGDDLCLDGIAAFTAGEAIDGGAASDSDSGGDDRGPEHHGRTCGGCSSTGPGEGLGAVGLLAALAARRRQRQPPAASTHLR